MASYLAAGRSGSIFKTEWRCFKKEKGNVIPWSYNTGWHWIKIDALECWSCVKVDSIPIGVKYTWQSQNGKTTTTTTTTSMKYSISWRPINKHKRPALLLHRDENVGLITPVTDTHSSSAIHGLATVSGRAAIWTHTYPNRPSAHTQIQTFNHKCPTSVLSFFSFYFLMSILESRKKFDAVITGSWRTILVWSSYCAATKV